MAESDLLATDIRQATDDLLERGYCIVPRALPEATIEALDADLSDDFERTPFGQGAFYGATTKRFGRLLIRSRHAAALVRHRLILGVAETVLDPWCDCIQLNTTQAIGIHPGAPAQMPHRDQKRGSQASAPFGATRCQTRTRPDENARFGQPQ